jgi:ABC-type nickel/cobalt efflux system permease component RcnA
VLGLNPDIALLCGTAFTVGVVHTAIGPDHYLPFVVMARARGWSLARTAGITVLCGLGHVLSSVVLGLLGVVLGIGVMRLEALEGLRGSLTAWLLIGFGLAYFVWGLHRALRSRPHRHTHHHHDGTAHDHLHQHTSDHAHVHSATGRDLTPWVLFTLFVLGPCEPLIPILMYPAAESGIGATIAVAAVFAVATIATMLAIVCFATWGVSFARLGRLERFAHAIAGATICVSGLAIQLLGL